MADPSKVQYVRDSIKDGLGIEDIKSALRQQGMSEDQVTEAINEAQGKPSAQPQPEAAQPQPSMKASPTPGQLQASQQPVKKRGRGKLIIALIVFFIILILFLYVAVTIVGDFREMFPYSFDLLPPELTNLGG